MKRTFLLSAVLTILFFGIQAQSADPVIMTVNGDPILKSEFEYIYNKNNSATALDKKSLDDYVNLFVNFKLKVAEAKAKGYDLRKSYQDELGLYRKQLAAPYMADKGIEESLIQEAYDRMKQDVDVSHILVKTTQTDTLSAYEKIYEIYDKLEKGGDFDQLAKEYSENNSSIQGGHLGYITAFMTVYPFETAAYNTPVGKYSKPIRSPFGYHIVKVNGRRPNRGTVRVAHILITAPTEAQAGAAKEKADSISLLLKNGASFADLAKQYSDDKQSGARGGEVGWVSTGRYPVEFENAAFALQKKDELSPVVKAPYGYHIIKLLERKELDTYSDLHDEIKKNILRDERAQRIDEAYIEELKSKHGFEAYVNALQPFYAMTESADDAEMHKIQSRLDDPLFVLDGITHPQKDFLDRFLNEKAKFDSAKKAKEDAKNKKTASSETDISGKDFVDKIFAEYIKDEVITQEEKDLTKEHPDYRNLLQEYSDGLLLFDISNDEVWNKASQDIEGLEKFFEANRGNYTWDAPRFRGKILYCANDKILKEAEKMIKKNSSDTIDVQLRRKFNSGKDVQIKIENGLYAKGVNKAVDAYIFKQGNYTDEKLPAISCIGELVYEPQSYKDIRGPVTADYQNYLEDKWIKELRNKYKVVINQDVLKTVKSN